MEDVMRICNCMICKNFDIDEKTGNGICPAYPEGIPEEIEKRYDPSLENKVCKNNTKFEPNCKSRH